jgi:hypothetical protein
MTGVRVVVGCKGGQNSGWKGGGRPERGRSVVCLLTQACTHERTHAQAAESAHFATAALAWVEVVPMMRAPSCRHTCVSSCPVPPAAACTSTQSPAGQGCSRGCNKTAGSCATVFLPAFLPSLPITPVCAWAGRPSVGRVCPTRGVTRRQAGAVGPPQQSAARPCEGGPGPAMQELAHWGLSL